MANKWNNNFLQDSDNFMTSLFKVALSKEPRCGLYLIGETSFNPFTKKVEYWVKVGKTKDASKDFPLIARQVLAFIILTGLKHVNFLMKRNIMKSYLQ